MDNNFNRMLCNGSLIDLNKSSEDELLKIIDDLEKQQVAKKSKLMSILNKISEEE